jgi:CHAT domain-containing protein
MVLGPAREALGGRRLLVVADGALHYVPFAALPDPSRTGPMIERYEVVTAPSAAVVALLRAEGAQRAAPSRTLAALADPVFTRDDARLAARSPRAAPAAAPGGEALTNALRDTGGGTLSRLPFTRREAEAILALVPPGQRKAAFDFEASRSTATDSSLADYRFVHVATHGFLNGAHPELSGIVLSLVGRDGAAERGFLTTTDVFHLHLNADMVTLSGCRTALGQEMRGEGLVGLARGFMYAGTPRVLASLWKVDDAATAALMKRVYAGILTRHLPPAAALRAAQLDLRREPRFHDPFYWAGFQLQGEWR